MAAWLCERKNNLIPLLKFSSINTDNESVQELLSEAVSLVLIASKDGGCVMPFITVPSNLKKNKTYICFEIIFKNEENLQNFVKKTKGM